MNDKYEFLSKYSTNLSENAKNNKVDPIIGREEEIRNVIRILSRKSKNNPVLIGEPGVGKTAIIEGLAQKIVNGDVPTSLKNKDIYSLDIGSLVAGAKYQGEFEERLKGVINDVIEHNNEILLFIDEIHLLIGAGKTSGAMDAANLLKPMLARGELNCIGATTLNEYRENIEKDLAFERRFQKVTVVEPTLVEATNILRGLKSTFESYHGVSITDEAIVSAVKNSDRYISDRFLPDKAIDLVDEACANIKVQINSEPEELQNLRYEITNLEIESKALKSSKDKEAYKIVNEKLSKLKEEEKELNSKWTKDKEIISKKKNLKAKLIESQRKLETYRNELEYERAAELEYSIIPELEKELVAIENESVNTPLIEEEVTDDQILIIISRLTGIPLSKLQTTEKDKLLHVNDKLNSEVIGQEQATYAVSNAILRSRLDINDSTKPIGSFLFLGPTGVGKTQVAKALCDELFDDERKMLRIDMSEYMEKHSVSRLIGAPPGYIGYEAGGVLTEYVRRTPYTVVLFDEIEKAHSDVLNILLQILDEGHITDSHGRTVNFKNTIIIMTSNIGSEKILENPDITLGELETDLRFYLKPELINRINLITKFNPLDENTYNDIIVKELDELVSRLNDKNYKLSYNDEVINFINDETFTKEYGARPIKRFIENNIENLVAYKILEDDKDSYDVEVYNEEIVIN